MIASISVPARKGMACIGLAALLATGAASAQVKSGTTGIDASGNYRQERAACMSGMTQQDRATCLREAGAAAAEKRAGRLDTNADQYAANALKRCDTLQGEDRAACTARIAGRGDVQGSVAGGGVLRSVETVVLPPGQTSVRIEPKTADPVLVVPVPASR